MDNYKKSFFLLLGFILSLPIAKAIYLLIHKLFLTDKELIFLGPYLYIINDLDLIGMLNFLLGLGPLLLFSFLALLLKNKPLKIIFAVLMLAYYFLSGWLVWYAWKA